MNFDESISAKEKEAFCNTFANEMLISKETFIQKIDANRKGITVYELQSIQAQYGISIDALMYKAKELNIKGKESTPFLLAKVKEYLADYKGRIITIWKK